MLPKETGNFLKRLLRDYTAALKNVLMVAVILFAVGFTWYYANAREYGKIPDPFAGVSTYDLGAFIDPDGEVWLPQENLHQLDVVLGMDLPTEYNRGGFTPVDTVIAKAGGQMQVTGQTAEIMINHKLILLRLARIPDLPMTVQFGDRGINIYPAGHAVPRMFQVSSGGVALPEPYQSWTDEIYNLLMGDGWNPKPNAKKILASALANPAPVQVVLPAEKRVDGKLVSDVLLPDQSLTGGNVQVSGGAAPADQAQQNGLPSPQPLVGMVMKLKPDAGSQFDPFEFDPRPVGVPYLLTETDLRNVPNIPPLAIRYKHIDNPGAVIAWLNAHNSMEADQKYLDDLDAAGRQFNVNPLLLLAITGQEQSFVPVGTQGATEMIKNPFNVYGSWQVYAPGFAESALIAAQTVNRLSANCPPGMNPIHWIDSPANPNCRYAEDTDWWKGVSIFFSQLEATQNG